jgi:hypothetical protein
LDTNITTTDHTGFPKEVTSTRSSSLFLFRASHSKQSINKSTKPPKKNPSNSQKFPRSTYYNFGPREHGMSILAQPVSFSATAN